MQTVPAETGNYERATFPPPEQGTDSHIESLTDPSAVHNGFLL